MSRLFRTNELLKEKILEWYPNPGTYSTSIPGFIIARRDAPSDFERYFYKPMVILILQGSKEAILGSEEYRYSENQYMVSTVDLPATSRIIEASHEKPCLAVALEFDSLIIIQLLSEISENEDEKEKSEFRSFDIGNTDILLVDAFLRLTLLLEKSCNKPKVLSDMIKREIHYLLLDSSIGYQLKTLATQGTQYNKIAKAINILQQNYKRKLNMETLAAKIKMATSSFYKDFKKITTLSPIQYQKQLRLFEAQRLMRFEGFNAQAASFEVGYESATQFSREYKKLFGTPPKISLKKFAA